MKRLLPLLLCLLSLLPALGQGVFVCWNRFNPVPPSGTTPALISPLFHWFVSSDVPPNVVVSNQWNDRIDSTTNFWQMGSAAGRPTNGPAGIRFDGAQTLTNSSDIHSGNPDIGSATGCGGCDTFFFIFTPDGSAGSQAILSSTAGGNGYSVYMSGTTLSYWGQEAGSSTVGTISAGTTNDVAIRYTSSNTIWYVNGVSVKTNTTTAVDTIQMNTLGFWAAGSYKGSILELGWWTNYLITASDALKLHDYGTSTYGY